MKRTAIPVFVAVGLLLPVQIEAETVAVKNLKGQSMNVEVLGFTPSSGNVRIKRLPDGAIFETKLTVFDADSQDKIKKAAPVEKPKLDIKVSAGSRRHRVGESSYMKKMQITCTIKVENVARDIDLAETKFTVLLVGRNTERFRDRDSDWAKILSNQSVSRSIPAGKTLEFECKPVLTEYDSDKDSSNIGGWDYDGYVLILQDKDGNVIEAKTSIGPVETLTLKDPAQLKEVAKLAVGKEVQRNMLPLSRGSRVLN